VWFKAACHDHGCGAAFLGTTTTPRRLPPLILASIPNSSPRSPGRHRRDRPSGIVHDEVVKAVNPSNVFLAGRRERTRPLPWLVAGPDMAAARNNLRPERKCLLALFMVLTLSPSLIWRGTFGQGEPAELSEVLVEKTRLCFETSFDSGRSTCTKGW